MSDTGRVGGLISTEWQLYRQFVAPVAVMTLTELLTHNVKWHRVRVQWLMRMTDWTNISNEEMTEDTRMLRLRAESKTNQRLETKEYNHIPRETEVQKNKTISQTDPGLAEASRYWGIDRKVLEIISWPHIRLRHNSAEAEGGNESKTKGDGGLKRVTFS